MRTHHATRLVSAALLAVLAAACGRPSGESAPPASRPDSAEFRQAVEERRREMDKDEAIIENAPWFGRTGLSDDVEREVPRYLRRELGQLLSQPGALKAADLAYVGVFTEGVEVVHYWRMPPLPGSQGPVYAYVVASPPDRRHTGWGGRKPPG